MRGLREIIQVNAEATGRVLGHKVVGLAPQSEINALVREYVRLFAPGLEAERVAFERGYNRGIEEG